MNHIIGLSGGKDPAGSHRADRRPDASLHGKSMRTPDARKLIGKCVQWKVYTIRGDSRYGSFYREHSGVLEDVKGRNVLISGDWKWLPDLTDFEEKPSPVDTGVSL